MGGQPESNQPAARLVLPAVKRTLVVLGLAVVALGMTGSLSLVDGADSSTAPASTAFQVWLDADFVTPDAAPGDILRAGFTTWDPRRREFFAVGGIEARMRPATGEAEPSVATIESDFPGHIIVEFVVPPGGPGAVELGTSAQVCSQDGTCSDTLIPIAIAGIGPPPDADARQLVTATIQPIVGDVVVGRPTPVAVNVQPRGLWVWSALPVPDHLVVAAARRGEPPVATAEIRPTGAGNPYTGRLTVPDAGPLTLTVAVPGADGVDRVIDGSALAVTVIGGGPPESPSASDAGRSPNAPAGTDQRSAVPPIAWIVGIGLVLVVAVVVLRRALADL